MAPRRKKLQRISCGLCSELLKDPQTIPCNHNFCGSCIKAHFDGEKKDKKEVFSCPHCKQTYKTRPVMLSNLVLATLVEQHVRRMAKEVPAKAQDESICPRHNEPKLLFCINDDELICYFCVKDHGGHKMVSTAETKEEADRNLQESVKKHEQIMADKKRDMKELRDKVEAFNRSVDEQVEENRQAFGAAIRHLEKRSEEMEHHLRADQKKRYDECTVVEDRLMKELADLNWLLDRL